MAMDDFDDAFAGLDAFGADAFDGLETAPLEAEAMRAKLAKGAGFDLNDHGNGQRFAHYFGEDMMFVPRVGWHVWADTHWQKDPDELRVRRSAQMVAPLIKREVHAMDLPPWITDLVARQAELLAQRKAVAAGVVEGQPLDDADREELQRIDKALTAVAKELKAAGDPRPAHHRFAIQSGNSQRMNFMTSEAGVILARELAELDAHPLEVNTLSGVLRFTVTGSGADRRAEVALIPHARGQLLTKIMPVRWDRHAAPECPRFDAFLRRIMPDEQIAAFLMRWFALSMTARVEQKLCFFYGMGANGKSVLVDLMARIMGDYAATAKIESLTGTNRRGGGDATPDLVPLIGARFVRAAEPDEGMRWQEGLIKDLTGGEEILVRALHSDFVAVRPVFSLTISGNHKPDIRGTDDGIWRRLLLVPFDEQIPKEEQIPKAELDEILFAEADGIFARLVEALLDYLEQGLMEPQRIVDATAEFREESDPYGTFLDDACVITGNPEDSMQAKELVNAFHFWLSARGEGAFKDRTVALALKERSRRWRSKRNGQGFTARKSMGDRRYDGIKFNDVFRRAWNEVSKDAQGRAIGGVINGGDE
jgi:putative DNA primase/helicase